jgi:hypothetical protein
MRRESGDRECSSLFRWLMPLLDALKISHGQINSSSGPACWSRTVFIWGQGATTLEWTLPSPPSFHQFDALPRVIGPSLGESRLEPRP